ncbi:hypothetical protein [Chitinivorax sp. B]|uniref:hypothetical protein n=1 Tax=Chitinivorax sp. B TaxID=2502235 RepID=UPI0010FA4A31|nr:hypothetical protein [Chitinivorax sp. B]
MEKVKLTVAAPWSLSHYIPLNGFHPLYRALFEHKPSNISINTWDNIKLNELLKTDPTLRKMFINNHLEYSTHTRKNSSPINKAYEEYFFSANKYLTEMIPGDIELHHTAPFPSLKRPFIFHCESFAPIFLPFYQQGSGHFKNHEQLQSYYRDIFSNELCLGIFSHIDNTLNSISNFFKNKDIDIKLLKSDIGLSDASYKRNLKIKHIKEFPIFLFINSANQNPNNFFNRGGHIVLRFWEHFINNGRKGMLLVRCAKPNDQELKDNGVNIHFVQSELGKSILWVQDYLSNSEMSNLIEKAHILLLPSLSLHSASIIQSMLLGTVPIVTDTIGTDNYITDEFNGLILEGIKSTIWYKDPVTSILIDKYIKSEELDNSLLNQLIKKIDNLIFIENKYESIRENMISHALVNYSGRRFSENFWGDVNRVFFESNIHVIHKKNNSYPKLEDAILESEDIPRVFESATQPVRKIYTGQNIVWEMGGAYIHSPGNPKMELLDWSVVAQYINPASPKLTWSKSISELGGAYLSINGQSSSMLSMKFVEFISNILMPFPSLHSNAANLLKISRRYKKYLRFTIFEKNKEPDIELIMHSVAGYNVIRYFHLYYAIPQHEGEFIRDKADMGGYSSSFKARSLNAVLIQIKTKGKKYHNNDASDSVELVLEGYNGFNVVKYISTFYGIPQSDGAFDIKKIEENSYSAQCIGSSIDGVMHDIDQYIRKEFVSVNHNNEEMETENEAR